MDSIVAGQDQLIIKQIKEWGEILVGFETRNRYEIRNEQGLPLGYAAEEQSGFGTMLLRTWLGPMRQARIHVFDTSRREIGLVEKPFRFFFHRVDVYSHGQRVGAVQRRWSWLHRRYDVENASGEVVLSIVSPWLKIWTFELRDNDRPIGVIRKQWSGILREAFTDADTFGIEMPSQGMGDAIRKVLLGATFLIDFVHFENNQRR